MNVVDNDGYAPLHEAISGNNIKIINSLLERKDIDINIADGYGNTLPHVTAKFLIQHRLAQDQKADKPDYLYGQYSAYWDECHDEIEEMQQHKIGNSDISFFDILIANKQKLASYVNNYDVVKVLDAYNCEKEFSIYADKIKNQYTKGMNRKVAADIVLNFSIALNEYTSRMIFNFLDYEAIRNLCIAGHQALIENKQVEEFKEKQHANTEAAPEQLVEDDDDTVSGCFSCTKVQRHRKCVIL